MHETQERETLKDATLSTAKHLSVTQCNAWWPTFLFHSSSLSTVALPPRVAPIPVRFNRVYSKVTLGTLSVVYSPFFIPWMHKFIHKVKGADCPYRLSTRIFPLYCASPLLCRCLHPESAIEMSAFDYLAVNSLFTSPLQCHQQDILFCSLLYHLEQKHRWGMGMGPRTYMN